MVLFIEQPQDKFYETAINGAGALSAKLITIFMAILSNWLSDTLWWVCVLKKISGSQGWKVFPKAFIFDITHHFSEAIRAAMLSVSALLLHLGKRLKIPMS